MNLRSLSSLLTRSLSYAVLEFLANHPRRTTEVEVIASFEEHEEIVFIGFGLQDITKAIHSVMGIISARSWDGSTGLYSNTFFCIVEILGCHGKKRCRRFVCMRMLSCSVRSALCLAMSCHAMSRFHMPRQNYDMIKNVPYYVIIVLRHAMSVLLCFAWYFVVSRNIAIQCVRDGKLRLKTEILRKPGKVNN